MQTKYQSVVLMGHAGSGKGTQAALLAQCLGYEVFSTGEKVREIAAEDTPLGRQISDIHTTGWIPEWLASYLMTQVLLEDALCTGLVFESVARKPEEAHKLHEIHSTLERPYIVIHLMIDELQIMKRLLARNRAGYDTEERITQRIKAFHDETMQSITFFNDQGVLRCVDANQSEEAVLAEILAIITNE